MKPNKLVVGIDDCATEIAPVGGDVWQSIRLKPSDFKSPPGVALQTWTGDKELRLGASKNLRSNINGAETKRALGGDGKGSAPRFGSLRWDVD
jgi:hypothetical protein